jgi:2-keto-4-pentenoate hydratase/2-oxohepta-3-ene-1,7-dioic acid hydratase in catechol pathway
MRIAAVSGAGHLRANPADGRHATALPGDLIFTGTPSGVGLGRTPQRWLQPGDMLTSYIEGIGEMRHTFVTA